MPVPVLGTPLDPLGPGSWTETVKDVGWIADTGYIAYAATTPTRKARRAVLGGERHSVRNCLSDREEWDLPKIPFHRDEKASRRCHFPSPALPCQLPWLSPPLVGSAGLAPVMKLAAEAGLHSLAGRQLTVPTDKAANAGAKAAALVAGRCADADSFHDMAISRRGAMKRLSNACHAPSTVG